MTKNWSRTLADAEELLARFSAPQAAALRAMLEAEAAVDEEWRRYVAEQLQAALAVGDWKEVKRWSAELVKSGADIPARPPKSQRPRCGAKTRKGTPCQAPAVWIAGEPAPRNGRCRMHGGASTGPVTPEGRAAIRESNRRRARGETS